MQEDKTAVYRKVFMSSEGRVVLADLLEFAGIFTNHFNDDPREQERLNGQKDVGLYILDSLGITGDYETLTRALLSVPAKPKQKQEVADG